MLRRYFSYPKNLGDVLKTLDFENTAPESIMALWDLIHCENEKTVAKTISAFQFNVMIARLNSFPSFMFPIELKKQRVTLISEEIEKHCWGFSSMEDEDSNALVIIRMFPEIAEQKHIVPMRGDIIHDGIIKTQADNLLRNFVDFYVDDELFEEFVASFNKDFENFNYEKFVKEYFQRIIND